MEARFQLRRRAKRHMQLMGWSYRRAAKEVGRNHVHLLAVLNGRRWSRSLLEKIASLPPCPIVPRGPAARQQTKNGGQRQAESKAASLVV